MMPLLLPPALVVTPLQAPPAKRHDADLVLDDWHLAAAQADEARYFGHFAEQAVFLGTDATERWTKAEFRAWSAPFFKRGRAWSFRAVSRHLAFSADGRTAWFDEVLDTPNLGPARGTGVLVKEGKAWKIAQYNLTVPIPNPLMDKVKQLIEAQGKAELEKAKEKATKNP
ncbi:MAG: nuclear transport factor 2 family protein [Holophagaceae bacterium]|nr:nuclear transport factor 2 family protein [Holophagaceae bacterium]